NDHRIRVSSADRLDQAILGTSDFNSFDQAGQSEVFVRASRAVQKQRGYGDYFGFTLVAQGSTDAMLDCGVQAWDIAAIIPLIEEAGGIFTDWSGQKSINARRVLATNGHLHSHLLAVID